MDTESVIEQQDISTTGERPERRDARENRERLLEVAKQLFAEQGAMNTSMKDIAEAAGVGKGTLYRHFAHKGELCTAILHEDLTAFEARLDGQIANITTHESPLSLMDTLISERIRMTETHLPLLAVVEAESGGQGRARTSRPPFAAWTHRNIVHLLGLAVERGEVLPLDLDYTADAIVAVISPKSYRFHRDECEYSVERIIAGVRRLFIEGLRA